MQTEGIFLCVLIKLSTQLNTNLVRLSSLRVKELDESNIFINDSVIMTLISYNHNNYNFLKCDWNINCCILAIMNLPRVVIEQCNHTVG